MNVEGKTILITGATGFFGRYITEGFLEAGAKKLCSWVVLKSSKSRHAICKKNTVKTACTLSALIFMTAKN